MPLPPALAARLAKRGILSSSSQETSTGAKEDEEEVFAENYDDQNAAADSESSKRRKKKPATAAVLNAANDKTRFMGYPGCPNKWNVYHECLPWCLNTFGSGRYNIVSIQYSSRRLIRPPWAKAKVVAISDCSKVK